MGLAYEAYDDIAGALNKNVDIPKVFYRAMLTGSAWHPRYMAHPPGPNVWTMTLTWFPGEGKPASLEDILSDLAKKYAEDENNKQYREITVTTDFVLEWRGLPHPFHDKLFSWQDVPAHDTSAVEPLEDSVRKQLRVAAFETLAQRDPKKLNAAQIYELAQSIE
jgi:hypothetical protein